MSEHFVIAADRGHLRIFQRRQVPGQASPALNEIQARDFPAGLQSYVERATDMAGRFNSSRQQSRGPGAPAARQGMSIDERMPLDREEDRRQIRDLAVVIEEFLRPRPEATWDFAAGPDVHNAVLQAVSPATRARLRQSLARDLVNQPPVELMAHFEAP